MQSSSAVKQLTRIKARVRNVSLLVIALIVLFLVWQVAGALAPQQIWQDGQLVWGSEGTETAARIFNTVADVAMWLFLIVLVPTTLIATIQIATWLARNFGSLFEFGVEEEPEEQPDKEKEQARKDLDPIIIQNADAISSNLDEMRRRIAILQARRSKAQVELEAIRPLASTLVRLIQGVAAKMNALQNEQDRLNALQTALDAGDERAIAEVTAQVGDGTITSLANDPNRGAYVERLQLLISAEKGSITRQNQLLGGLAQDWISHLLDFREHMNELTALIDGTEALPMVVEIQGRLTTATETLGITQPQLQQIMASRTLPEIYVDSGRMARRHAPMLEGER